MVFKHEGGPLRKDTLLAARTTAGNRPLKGQCGTRGRDSRGITQLLHEWRCGDGSALNQLMPLVYDELRSLAAAYLRREGIGHTLQPTAVVHEAYLGLLGGRPAAWTDRIHFFAVTARLMRRLLVDHARGKRAVKRGGPGGALTFDEDRTPSSSSGLGSEEILDLERGLEVLARIDTRKCRVLELRYFSGLTVEETAEALEVSPETVYLDSRFARAWLVDFLQGSKT
ncbi:MAG: sigma-70 family RNA polymerase sigma factor [Acidobacteria bacterium]|nr:sigma-70 family RNA polymerase sigma factor [Acidobacteriota bacterium]